MPVKDNINKSPYIETVSGIGATLAGQATDTSAERELPWLSQTKIALEVTVAFHALADGGLRIRILEYMTSASAATAATPGNEGTIPLTAGATVRQTFLFTIRSRYYQVELFNLDSNAAQNATSIAIQVIEVPEGEQGNDGQTNTHTQYWDGNAWQPQLIMAWETGGNLDRITTAVEIMDDWDETDRAKINPIVGQAGVAAGAGIVGVTVPRVTLASDDPAVTALQIIDDWDETDRAKVNPIVGQAGIAAGAGVVGVTVPRVTLASDDPAVTALQIIDDWDETDRAKVNPIAGQAGVAAGAGASSALTQRTITATDSPDVVALETLDNAIKVDDAPFTPATDSVSMIGAEFDDTLPDSVDEGDAGALRMSANRNLYTTIRDAAGNERGANVTAANELNVLDSNSTAIRTAVEIIDDWDETDRAKVNPIVGQAGIAAGAGVVGVTVPRVTLASDDPAVTALQIIDDWDETDRAKVNPIVGQAGIAAGAGIVGVTVPRITLASDDPAVVALQIIDDWDETDRAKVNIIVGQAGIAAGAGIVGVTVPRVTLASDDPAVVALQTLDNAIKVDDAPFTPATDSISMIGAEFDDTLPDSVDEGDAGALRMSANRNLYATIRDAAGNERGANVTAANELNVLDSNSTAIRTAVEIIDDWDETDRAKVNPIVGQAGIAAGAGVVGVTVPRVTLASDDPAVTALQIIDDWDETDRAKVNPIVGQAGIAAGAGIVGVTVPRITLASDDPAVTALQIIDDWDETDRAKVNPIVGQAGIAAGAGIVGVTVPRVTLASDDPAVVALQTLDNTIKVDDAPFTPATDSISMIGAEFDDTLPDSVDEGDAGALRMSGNRNLYATLRDAAGNERGANITATNELNVLDSNSTAIRTAVEIIDDWDETDRAKVNPIVGQAGIAAGAGVVGVTVPRMTLASDDPAVVALQIIDDWDETDRAKVNPIAGQAGVAAGAGASSALTQRTITATDSPDVVALELLDNAIKVDDAAFTPATDSVSMIGAEFDDTLPDSVDEGDAGALRMSGNRNLYTTIRDAASNERGANITAANELNVLDSNSSAIRTAVEIIDDWDETDRAKVNPIVGQAGIAAGAGVVGVTVPRVTLASDDPAVTALNKIDGISTLADAVETAVNTFTKTVAAIITPEALAGAGTLFRRATIIAKKAARTANTGIVYLGVTSADNTQPLELNPGDIFTIEAPPGEKYDFDSWYLDVATAADGVIVFYS